MGPGVIGRWLYRTGRAFYVVPFSLGVLLSLVTLPNGFFADDYGFIAMLDGVSPRRVTPFDLYEFARGDPQRTFDLVRRGPFPWWTAPDLKVRFFRPLSSALFALDHALFGHTPLGYHVDAVIVWAALLLAAGALLRAALSLELAALAFALFALVGSHAEPVAWISSRHLVIAAAPSVAGLAAYVAYRERGFAPGRWLAVLGAGVGLLGGEDALAVLLYWSAYDLVGAAPGVPWAARARHALLPLGIAGAYLATYKASGFGSAHNGMYIDPLSDPVAFAGVLLQRIPVLLSELFAGAVSGLSTVLSPWPFVIAGLVASSIVALLLRAVWPAILDSDRRALKWLTLGALASLLVSAGGFPGSRLLLLPSIGGSAMIGAILRYGWARAKGPAPMWLLRRAGVGLLFFIHVVAAPLTFILHTRQLGKMGDATAEVAVSLDEVLGRPVAEPKIAPDVFVLCASDPLAGLYGGAARQLRAPGSVSSWNSISMAHATHHLRRTGERTIVLRTEEPMLRGMFEWVFRSPADPLRSGDSVELDAAKVKVLRATAAGPDTLELQFHASIGAPSLRLLAWRDGRLVPVDALDVGQEMTIAWSPGPTGFW